MSAEKQGKLNGISEGWWRFGLPRPLRLSIGDDTIYVSSKDFKKLDLKLGDKLKITVEKVKK